MPLGLPVQSNLTTQGNIGNAYHHLGRLEEALPLRRDVYSGWLKLSGEECFETLREANNYAMNFLKLKRHKEARSLTRKTIPVARRVLGEDHRLTLSLRWIYANALSLNESATVADLSEAVTTLESAAMSYKRVLGQGHPETPKVQKALQSARAKLALVRASTAS